MGSAEQSSSGTALEAVFKAEFVVSCANATVGIRVAETSMAQVFFMR